MAKMDSNEFKEKAEAIAKALQGFGFAINIRHDRFLTFFTFIDMRSWQEMSIYNSDDGVIYTPHLDLSVRLKEFNDYLEVVDA